MAIANIYKEITGTLAGKICSGCESLEVEFSIEYEVYGGQEFNDVEIDRIEIVGFLDNGNGFSVEISEDIKNEVLALIDKNDFNLLTELEEIYLDSDRFINNDY